MAPLSGIVRADGRPVPGATLVVRGVTAGGAMFMRLVKSEPDGTFVLPDAAEGLYTVLSVVPGFRPAVARLFHRPAAAEGALSFVRLDLERPSGVLPETATGALDAWGARAVVVRRRPPRGARDPRRARRGARAARAADAPRVGEGHARRACPCTPR